MIRLYNRLGEVLGEEQADTIVNTLATKADLAELKASVDALRDSFGARFDKLEQGFWDLNMVVMGLHKTILWSMVACTTVLTAIFSAVVAILVR